MRESTEGFDSDANKNIRASQSLRKEGEDK